jgi:hypothetical protein
MRRAGFTLLRLLLVLAAVALLLGCMLDGGPALYLLVGWIFFLIGVLPRVRVDGSVLLTAIVCLAGFLAGLHLFLRWFAGQWKRAGDGDAPPRRWQLRWTLAVVGVVVLAFTSGIAAVGITHQTAWLATQPEPFFEGGLRAVVAHSQSHNNLRQIGLATLGYTGQHKTLPAGAAFDRQGRALHGWQTALLPYIEQEELHKRIKHDLPWSHPANAAAFRTVVRTYQHPLGEPKIAPSGLALSHYAANVHVLGGNVPRSPEQIGADRGTSRTILAGEVAAGFRPWGDPINWRDPAQGIHRSPHGFGSPLGPGKPTQFVMADGSVRTFTADTDPEFLELLASPDLRRRAKP